MYKIITLILTLLSASCVHDKHMKAQAKCSESNDPLECGKLGYYEFRLGQRASGLARMTSGCFTHSKVQVCKWFQQIAPNEFAAAKVNADPVRIEQSRLAAEAQQKEAQEKLEAYLKQVSEDCQGMKKAGYVKSADECTELVLDEGFEPCRAEWKRKSKDARSSLDDCIWAQHNPTEAFCQDQVKRIGGNVWDCIRTVDERKVRALERETATRQHNEAMAVERARIRSQEQIEQNRINAEAWRELGRQIERANEKMNTPPPPPPAYVSPFRKEKQVKCETRPNLYGSGSNTTCKETDF